MTEREKVIKGLECCMSEKGCHSPCPYNGECEDGGYYYSKAIEDALALLKAQQPRVLSLVEVKALEHNTVVWYEHIGANPPRPRVVHYANDEHIVFSDGGDFRYGADGYGKHFRLWTFCPTDSQSKETPWKD